jgi:hypothetical protein
LISSPAVVKYLQSMAKVNDGPSKEEVHEEAQEVEDEDYS